MKTDSQCLNLLKLGIYVISHRERLGVGLRNRCYAGVAIEEARKSGTTVAQYYGIGLNQLITAIKINNRTNPLVRNIVMFFHSMRLLLI